MRAMLILLGAVALISSCAGGSPILMGCPAISWDAAGESFGKDGWPAGTIEDYAKVCEQARSPDARRAWMAGWEKGHAQYCTPKGAYWVGRKNGYEVKTEICPSELAPDLLEANEIGMKFYDLEEQIRELEEEGGNNLGTIFGIELRRERQKQYDIFPR